MSPIMMSSTGSAQARSPSHVGPMASARYKAAAQPNAVPIGYHQVGAMAPHTITAAMIDQDIQSGRGEAKPSDISAYNVTELTAAPANPRAVDIVASVPRVANAKKSKTRTLTGSHCSRPGSAKTTTISIAK